MSQSQAETLMVVDTAIGLTVQVHGREGSSIVLPELVLTGAETDQRVTSR